MKRKKYVYLVVERGAEPDRDTACNYLVCGTRLLADINCRPGEKIARFKRVPLTGRDKRKAHK